MPTTRIALGNGSCDILLAAGQALLEPGAELVYAWPSFSIYPQLSAASGAREIRVPVDERHEHDFDAMAQEITAATRLVIVCNPNNPTSTALPFEQIKAFVERVPSHVALILDEAYCEYSTLDDPDVTLDLLDDHPNLVLLRTFSKIYGLAGLRVGFGLCGSEEFVGAVNQVRQPFFVNVAAQAAAVEALRHQDAVAERVERAVVARLHIEEGLARLGMQVADSQANFVWFDLPGGRRGGRDRARPQGARHHRPRRAPRSAGRARCASASAPSRTTSASSTCSRNCCSLARRMTAHADSASRTYLARRYYAWRFI